MCGYDYYFATCGHGTYVESGWTCGNRYVGQPGLSSGWFHDTMCPNVHPECLGTGTYLCGDCDEPDRFEWEHVGDEMSDPGFGWFNSGEEDYDYGQKYFPGLRM